MFHETIKTSLNNLGPNDLDDTSTVHLRPKNSQDASTEKAKR